MLPSRRNDLLLALAEPDEVRRRSWRLEELLFVRHSGEGDVVVVVTAYVSTSAPLSEVLWIKP